MTEKELKIIQFFHYLSNPWIAFLFTVLAVWTIVWKGVALWRAARNNSPVWFVVILIANTLGILDIIYIFFFSNPSTGSGQDKKDQK